MENPFEIINARLSNIENSLADIAKTLNEIKQPKESSEYLTRSGLAEMLKCDPSTLWLWTKKGKLKAYGIGNRVYYKRSEVEEAIKQIK